MQLNRWRAVATSPGQMHAQAHAANRRARRNAPSNIKGKHPAANVALAGSAGEKVITSSITEVGANVLVQRVVFAGVNIDSCCACYRRTHGDKRGSDHARD